MCLTPRLFLGEVLLLTLLASIIASSSIVQQQEQIRTVADGRTVTQPSQPTQANYKYYSNRKGTQVVEIGPDNSCQVFQGEDAAWLRDNKKGRMTELNYFQFRLMVGKCQLTAFFNRKNPYTDPKLPKPELNHNRIANKTETDAFGSPINSREFNKIHQSSTPNYNKTGGEAEVEEPTTPATLPLIFPGTKWCGAGSSARSHDDLGIYVETDKCCREHDLCAENMEGKECKHGLCNDSEFTRSHCDCDDKFRVCLQRDRTLSSLASFKIANLYFNILKPLCFAQRPPVKSCRRHRITGECIDFEFDPEYRAEWQFFPSQPFLTEAVEKLISPALPTLPALPFFQRPTPAQITKPDGEDSEEDHHHTLQTNA